NPLLRMPLSSSGFEGQMSLNGLGATRIEVSQQEPEASGEGATGYAALPSTTLSLDAQGRCVYGLVPADGGKQLKLFIKTDIGARTSGRVRVVLDAGHGGKDTGAIGPSGVYEKDINLPITLEVGRILEGEGVEVTYTRSDDTYLTLSERSQVANAIAADVFVSVHCNGSTDRSKEGTSVYWYAPADNALLAAQEFDRCKLAGFIQEALLQALGRTDKGVRTANFAVLRETTMPSALVETLFLSHPLEEQLLAMPETQSTAAAAIARGILDYLRWAGRK
ncbi:MAG: N-acetylmuramoyl-L-alanine amidase, partial [Syntrophomonadaceae bacterium]|nr:N-acetylmuramoyl-L-alanine amidase [Syntrophomonadaceae bacterium]